MKQFIIALLVLFFLVGCNKSDAEAETTPEIVCGHGRNIVVLKEKYYFLPRISGDIIPLSTGECQASIPNNQGFIIVECAYDTLRFKNGETVVLPEKFLGGFNFYYSKK
jgi:hypothetical protein